MTTPTIQGGVTAPKGSRFLRSWRNCGDKRGANGNRLCVKVPLRRFWCTECVDSNLEDPFTSAQNQGPITHGTQILPSE